ncbi:MAG: hypothetical protein R3C11_02255 [Planctomycetaceae bacterium]
MLTGRPPFRGKTILEVIQKHKYGQFDHARTVVPEIPYWLDELVCQLLEKDPDKRVPDAYVLSRRLQEILKKVELSQSEMTQSLDPDPEGGAATTVAINPNEPVYQQKETQASRPSSPSVNFPHESGGTLMREMLRAEIEQTAEKSALARFFDNTWVLIFLMICVLFGFYLWYAGIIPSNATTNIDSEDSSDSNERIRLVELDWKRALKRTEAERLYTRGVRQFEEGHSQQAIETLTALLTLIEATDKSSEMIPRVKEKLSEIEQQQEEFINIYITQAETLLSQGELGKAQTLISSLNILFGNDSRVRNLVEQFNQALQQRKPGGE